MPEIAIKIITKGDPIEVDTQRLIEAIRHCGHVAHLVDIDWADSAQWLDTIDPMRAVHGRHSTSGGQFQDREYQVRWYLGAGGGFVRDFMDHERELEDVA